MTASFPPINAYYLAYVSFIPLLFALRESTLTSAIFTGFFTGLLHETILLSWIIPTLTNHAQFSFTYAFSLTIIMSAILAINFVVFTVLVHFLSKKPYHLFVLPFLWVSIEFVRSYGQLAFPWELIGYSQYKWITLIQFSDISGVYGVSGFVVLINVCIFICLLFCYQMTWNKQNVSKSLLALSITFFVCIPIIILTYGSKQIQQMDHNSDQKQYKKVMIVQPSILQDEKWEGDNRIPITQKMVNMTFQGKNKAVDLVVWPETALPYALHSKHQLRQFVLQSMKQMNAGLIVGSLSFIEEHQQTTNFNSAYVIDKKGHIQSRYDKVSLVPFSEFLPYSFLKNLWMFYGAPDDKFKPGKVGQVHQLDDFQLGIQICFEIIFPQYARILTANGSNLLINISNDGWFGQTASPYQHFSMAIFRAVENKRALIRCANTGISGIIDPCGRIISQSQLYETTSIIHQVPIVENKHTFYSKWGDFFAIGSMIISLLFGLTQMIIFLKNDS